MSDYLVHIVLPTPLERQYTYRVPEALLEWVRESGREGRGGSSGAGNDEDDTAGVDGGAGVDGAGAALDGRGGSGGAGVGGDGAAVDGRGGSGGAGVGGDQWADLDLTGHRARVTFSGRSLLGVITGRTAEPPPKGRLLDVEELPDLEPALTPELVQLTRWMASYYACSWGEAARAALPPDGSPRSRLYVQLEPGADGSTLRGERQKAVLEALVQADTDAVVASELLEDTGASHSTLRSLETHGLIRVFESDALQSIRPTSKPPTAGLDYFHPTQRAAAETLRNALNAGQFGTFLLHGVTGSGKTEVYIDALSHAIGLGKTGIVLVPEIALTPQTVRRFRRHFGERVAVLHSRLSAGSRFDTWRRIRQGQYDVVIGPRSAIFAPLENIGVIMVDEEHESSYKQFEPAPRYHARDVAVVRASNLGAVCVLGSATPSLESFHNARTGKYTLLSMPDRVPVASGERAVLPEVRVVDMLADRRRGQGPGIISAVLRNAIDLRLSRKEQIILLQNRRGFSPVLSCDTCGHTPECPDCSVSLTWHKALGQGRCHYCGRAFRTGPECRECGKGQLEPVGIGTQRVEEELESMFPDARILRMDMDTTTRKDSHDTILRAFGAGEADMLVGTQMVAKGLDFGRVTLVGVVDADAGLLFPDFRADERTFQLLTQVAGRAGRADLKGEVILQTRNPRHPIIALARHHDYLGFAEAALETRQLLDYPPFTRAVRLEFRGPEERDVRSSAERFATTFRSIAPGLPLVGPAPAFVARVRRSWRYLALIKMPRSVGSGYLRKALDLAQEASGKLPRGVRVNVDVDPMGML